MTKIRFEDLEEGETPYKSCESVHEVIFMNQRFEEQISRRGKVEEYRRMEVQRYRSVASCSEDLEE